MTREELKNFDLDKSGLLYGLSGLTYDTCKGYLKCIDYDRVKNDDALQFIAPAVRRIIVDLLLYKAEEDEKIIKIEVMGSVNVNDIIDGLDSLYSELIPIAKKHFGALDIQSEIMLLFCDNYKKTITKKAMGKYIL